MFTGDACEESGIYRVTHWRHRFPHRVIMAVGATFPACKTCGNKVVYEIVGQPTVLNQPIAIKKDSDFADHSAKAKGRP